MGRMADARKRARRKADGADGAVGDPPAPANVHESPTPLPASAAPVEPVPTPTPPIPLADAAVGPPAAAAAPAERPGRIELPASGLAEDILARVDVGTADLSASPAEGSGAELAPPVLPTEPAAEADAARAHNISFFAAPSREDRVVAEATEHLATFFLDREEYGVDVRLVQEIRRLTEITQVPRAPEFIKGVINLRGRIIPVVDLKLRLAMGEVAPTRTARIVVVKLADRLIGLLVDGASQVLKVPVSTIEPPPDEVVEKGGTYIRGVAKLEKRLIILIDLHRILELGARGEADAQPGMAVLPRGSRGQGA
jgi:purine-binding chemotaxis protein CheW